MIHVYCAANLQSRVKKGKMSQEKFEKTLSLVKGVLTYDVFKSVDMVIEVRRSLVNLVGVACFLAESKIWECYTPTH